MSKICYFCRITFPKYKHINTLFKEIHNSNSYIFISSNSYEQVYVTSVDILSAFIVYNDIPKIVAI